MYAKFISEDQIKIAPVTYKDPTCIAFHFNQNVELMKSKGFYEVVETNTREDVTDETHYAVPKYAFHEDKVTEPVIDEETGEPTEEVTVVEDNSYIECTYVAVEIPAPEEPVEEVTEEEPQEEVEEEPQEEAPEIEGEG